MDGRILVGGFVAAVAFGAGWAVSGTLRGALLSAGFVVGCFLLDSILDRYLYGLHG